MQLRGDARDFGSRASSQLKPTPSAPPDPRSAVRGERDLGAITQPIAAWRNHQLLDRRPASGTALQAGIG